MIYNIFQMYFSVLMPVLVGSLIIFLTGLYWILSSSASKTVMPAPDKVRQNEDEKIAKTSFTITKNDIAAISGEDAISTQLDLARAYIESGRKQLAKKILDYVVLQGSNTQKKE